MDKELARHVVATAFRSLRELEDLIPLLKEHCGAAEYETYVKAIASVSGHVHWNIVNPAFAGHPELEKEEQIERYGKIL